MLECPRCGEQNPDRARFCLNCGSTLAVEERAVESRRTVTILFADVVNSTGRGESTDPETTRHRLARYFDAMKVALERHGGTVEKFIGDAVMAVFGIPTIHEDDALRAVRAAQDMLTALEELNVELAAAGWSPIAVRVGINTGEVVTGDPSSGQTLVTGDAVNVAARLEQAAGAGEILIGASTHQLARANVEADVLPPLELKGKAEPVAAYRLTSVTRHGGGGRRHDTPLVGRERELRMLGEAYDRVVSDAGCHLFTLLGPAGVGKSRLVHEFLGTVRGEAQVLRARCLPYGEGITYWPITELVQATAGIAPTDATEDAIAKLTVLVGPTRDQGAIVERVASAMGLSSAALPTDEVFFGVRRLLETLAQRQPLVVVIDDLHWAEPAFLDLVEQISDLSRGSPILLLAIARAELLDIRPQWGGGKLNATTMFLDGLSSEQSVAMVTNLIGDPILAAAVQERVGETAEGNPLFVEELVAMLIDEGVLQAGIDGWVAADRLERMTVPPTVAALVAARLDRLEAAERDLVGRASVVGKVFGRAAVAELSPPERRTDLSARLMSLVRKELVRPDRSSAMQDDSFRFRHILVRDAAYGSLPKEQRAELHGHFADWLEQTAGDRLHEYQEVIAYHLEQAHDARAELGLMDARTAELAARAASYLRDSGDRSMRRRDQAATVSLLGRAARLTADPRQRGRIFLSLAEPMGELGDMAGLEAVLDEAQATALAAGDELLAKEAEMQRLHWAQFSDPTVDDQALLELAADVLRRAEAVGDLRAAASAHQAFGDHFLTICRWGDQLAELEVARTLLERIDEPTMLGRNEISTLNAMRYGPVTTSRAIERFEAVARERPGMPLLGLGSALYAMQGRFEEARRHAAYGIAFLHERGLRGRVGGMALATGTIELLADDLVASVRAYTGGIEILAAVGETGVLSTLAAQRAMVQHRAGDADGAVASIELAREAGAGHDIATQAGWRLVGAMLAADRGDQDEADRLAGEALELTAPTDFLELRGQAREAAAHVHAVAGRTDEAQLALRSALAEYEAKEDIVDAERVRAALETMAGP